MPRMIADVRKAAEEPDGNQSQMPQIGMNGKRQKWIVHSACVQENRNSAQKRKNPSERYRRSDGYGKHERTAEEAAGTSEQNKAETENTTSYKSRLRERKSASTASRFHLPPSQALYKKESVPNCPKTGDFAYNIPPRVFCTASC